MQTCRRGMITQTSSMYTWRWMRALGSLCRCALGSPVIGHAQRQLLFYLTLVPRFCSWRGGWRPHPIINLHVHQGGYTTAEQATRSWMLKLSECAARCHTFYTALKTTLKFYTHDCLPVSLLTPSVITGGLHIRSVAQYHNFIR